MQLPRTTLSLVASSCLLFTLSAAAAVAVGAGAGAAAGDDGLTRRDARCHATAADCLHRFYNGLPYKGCSTAVMQSCWDKYCTGLQRCDDPVDDGSKVVACVCGEI